MFLFSVFPEMTQIRGGAAHFLGAKPTQSMAFPVCLHQGRRRFRAARRIFLVQSRRNQWLSRFACTKAAAGFGRRGAFSWCKADVINGFSRFACTKGAAGFRRRGAFSWCKAYAINGFPSLLAPSPPPVSGGVAHFLGAKPTQSMAFPVCLHQDRRRFRAARRIFLVQSLRNQWLSRLACTKSPAGFGRRGAFSWCKADAINGFPGLLTPKAARIRGRAVHFLGAKPT